MGIQASLAFSPDGATLASASGVSERVVKLWEVQARRRLATLPGHRAYIHALAFSPLDGKTLASASSDQTIRLWNAATHEQIALLAGHQMEVWALAYSPDGARLASGGKDGAVCIWDASHTKSRRGSRVLTARVKHAEFSPDSRTLATLGQSDGTVTLWEVASGGEIRPLPELGTHNVELAFSPDGDLLLAGDAEGVIRVWSLGDQRLLVRPLQSDLGRISLLGFLPGGNSLAVVSVTRGVELWECADWKLTKAWKFDAPYASTRVHLKQDLAIASDGGLIARAQQDETVRLWWLWSGEPFDVLCEQPRMPSGIVFTPDCTRLVTSSTFGVIHIWDLATKHVSELRGPLTGMESLAVSPDGLRIVSPSRNELRIWDAVSKREVCALPAQGQIHFLTAFAPDGNSFVVVDSTGAAQVWSAPTIEEIEAAEPSANKATGTTRE